MCIIKNIEKHLLNLILLTSSLQSHPLISALPGSVCWKVWMAIRNWGKASPSACTAEILLQWEVDPFSTNILPKRKKGLNNNQNSSKKVFESFKVFHIFRWPKASSEIPVKPSLHLVFSCLSNSEWRLSQLWQGERRGYTPNISTICHSLTGRQSFTPRANSKLQFNLACMSLGCENTLKHHTGKWIWSLHLVAMRPWC